MPRAVRFYRMLGFELVHGGEDAAFTSFRAGANHLNLIVQPHQRRWSWWGRVIFYDSDVDGFYSRVIAAGLKPDTEGQPWLTLHLGFAWARRRFEARRRQLIAS